VLEHRTPVQHALMERPLLADEGLRPRSGGGDDREHIGAGSRHNRDDALRLGDDSRALDGHGLEQVLQGDRVPTVGGNVVEQPRDKATDRLVDPACLVVGRMRTGVRADGRGRRKPPGCFGHSYSARRQTIFMIATISLKIGSTQASQPMWMAVTGPGSVFAAALAPYTLAIMISRASI
jgi:hypothetical protein